MFQENCCSFCGKLFHSVFSHDFSFYSSTSFRVACAGNLNNFLEKLSFLISIYSLTRKGTYENYLILLGHEITKMKIFFKETICKLRRDSFHYCCKRWVRSNDLVWCKLLLLALSLRTIGAICFVWLRKTHIWSTYYVRQFADLLSTETARAANHKC